MPNPTDYAIVVGIDHYRQIAPMLRSAEKDARDFAAWLAKPDGGGVPAANMCILLGENFRDQNLTTPPVLHQPNKLNVDARLQELRVDQQGFVAGRRLYVFFSGHGIGVQADDVAMLMANASPISLRTCHIGLRGYRNWLHNAASFSELVFFLDCCRTRGTLTDTAGPVWDPILNAPAFRNVKFVTVLSTLDGDEAFDVQANDAAAQAALLDRHGLLSRALREGLTEGRARDAAGAITSLSLAAWVKERVAKLAELAGVEQKAEALLPSEPMILVPAPAATVAAPPAAAASAPNDVKITVTFVPPVPGPVQLYRADSDQPLLMHMAAPPEPWSFTIPLNTLYRLRHTVTGSVRDLRPFEIQGGAHAVQL
jgi:hypothetical protein